MDGVDKVVIQITATNTDQPTYIESSIEKAKMHVGSNIALAPGDVVNVMSASDDETGAGAEEPDPR